MGEFNLDDYYIYYCRQESLRINGVALRVNKRVQNAVLGCNIKTDRIISVCFQGKPLSITLIQVYRPTTDAEEVSIECFYEDLQNLSQGQQHFSPPPAESGDEAEPTGTSLAPHCSAPILPCQVMFPKYSFPEVRRRDTQSQAANPLAFFTASKSLWMMTAAMKLKDACSLEEKL